MRRRRKPRTSLSNPAAVPLDHAPRELFAQLVAQGIPVPVAYQRAGYKGQAASRYELRHAQDVDDRIKWLLAERIESDARARAHGIKKEQDARLRLIERLEAIAYQDPRDIAQWDRTPVFDDEGHLVGWKNEITITPSRFLTKEQAAMVRLVTTKGNGLRFEVNDPLVALGYLAKIVGLTAPDAQATVHNTQVNVGQVNVSGSVSALEAARRLAFALEKAKRAAEAAQAASMIEGRSLHEGPRE